MRTSVGSNSAAMTIFAIGALAVTTHFFSPNPTE